MAATGVKFDEGTGGFAANCFPVRTLLRTKDDGNKFYFFSTEAISQKRLHRLFLESVGRRPILSHYQSGAIAQLSEIA